MVDYGGTNVGFLGTVRSVHANGLEDISASYDCMGSVATDVDGSYFRTASCLVACVLGLERTETAKERTLARCCCMLFLQLCCSTCDSKKMEAYTASMARGVKQGHLTPGKVLTQVTSE
jgi:hypothetical protein